MNDKAYITHIVQSIDRILTYTSDVDESGFYENFLVQDAVIRNLQIIGEATKKISKTTKEENPSIMWKAIAGMRDKLIHDYFGVDLETVWIVLKKELPGLRSDLMKLL